MEIGKEYDMEISYSTIDVPGVPNPFNESIDHCEVKIKTDPLIVGDVLFKNGDSNDDKIDIDKLIYDINHNHSGEKFNQKDKRKAIEKITPTNKNFFYIYEIDEFEEKSNLERIDTRYVKEIQNFDNLKKMKECDVKLYNEDYKFQIFKFGIKHNFACKTRRYGKIKDVFAINTKSKSICKRLC